MWLVPLILLSAKVHWTWTWIWTFEDLRLWIWTFGLTISEWTFYLLFTHWMIDLWIMVTMYISYIPQKLIKYNTQTANFVLLDFKQLWLLLWSWNFWLKIEKFVIQNYIVVYTYKAINVAIKWIPNILFCVHGYYYTIVLLTQIYVNLEISNTFIM